MFLNKTEVLERIKRCKENNLCYITIHRLEDYEGSTLEIEYFPGIFVKVIADERYIKY